MVKVAKISH